MRLLIDTGVLLRYGHPQFPEIERALRSLRADGHTFVVAGQNLAEFWNVCTRPAAARGGFGLTVAEAERRLTAVEHLTEVITESAGSYAEWRQLILRHGVSGVQVHDARLVAVMRVEQVPGLLTLNPRDFARYAGLTVVTPEQVLQGTLGPP